MVYVFVYGTLREGECNSIVEAAARSGIVRPERLGHARVPGRLYDFGSWPGLVPMPSGESNASTVAGDVYAIRPALLPVLDAIEGITATGREAFYRDTCRVMVGSMQYDCVYYPVDVESVAGCPVIVSGDWLVFRSRG